jgi:hypothetical protein
MAEIEVVKPWMDLSVIIVNFNSANYVMECVRSLYEQTTLVRYEVIVVDNASYDDCHERLACHFSDVIFLQSHSNLGFGGANNLGAKHARGEVLLFLNPDTEVRDGAIDRLYQHFRTLNQPGAVGCRLLNRDGSLQTSCVQSFPTVLNQVLDAAVLQRLFPKSDLWGTAVLFEKDAAAAKVEVVSGACLMIRKEVFDCVGGFSPEYFMYGEDLDLCFKVRRAGLHNYHVGDVLIMHHGGGSTKKSVSNFSNRMMRESVFRFLLKFRGRLYGDCYRAAISASAVIRLAVLAVFFPIWCARWRAHDWNAVFRKWLCIFEWGLGLKRFGQNQIRNK